MGNNIVRLVDDLEEQDLVAGTYGCEDGYVWISAERGRGEVALDGHLNLEELKAVLAFITPEDKGA